MGELAAHTFVGFRSPRQGRAGSSGSLFGTLPVAQARIVADDMSTAREMARRHVGLVALPSFLGDPDVEHGLLVSVLPTWKGPRPAIYLVRPRGRNLPARVALFRDALATALRALRLA